MATIINQRGFDHHSLCMRMGAVFVLILLPLQALPVKAGRPAPAIPARPNAPAFPAAPKLPPVAVDDSFSAYAHQPILTANVLTNDSDPIFSSLFIKSFDTQGTKGLVTLMNPWQDSSLDLTFGTGGKVSTSVGTFSGISAIAIQPDQKILAAGTPPIGSSAFALARYNKDGSLDTSFNGSGTATVQFTSANQYLHAMLLQPDGKIVVAGEVYPDMALARFNPDGSLDPSFSGDGLLLLNFGSSNDYAYSLARQTDGKILVAGNVYGNFGLARLNANGSLDTSFSGDGKVTTDFGGEDWVQTVLVQTNGKIVAVGGVIAPSVYGYYNYQLAVARYNTNGSLDTTFGSGGKVTTPPDYRYYVGQAVLQPDGKILVSGDYALQYTDIVGLLRYNTNGSLDTSFGTDGMALTDLGKEPNITSLALQPGGKILVAGMIYYFSVTDFLLLRFADDGCLDTSFGTEGEVTIDFAGDKDDAYALALQQDGKIIVAGEELFTADNGTSDSINFALARVNKDGHYELRNSFRYDPNGQFAGLLPGEQAYDTFTYVASNGILTSTAVVTITVSGGIETYLPLLAR